MRVNDLRIKVVPDSRGKDTLRAELKSGKTTLRAEVPSGKSRGNHEVFVLEPKKAIKKFESIKEQILKNDFKDQESFDDFLIALDNTPNKGNLGGNLILVLSMVWARAKAREEGGELYQYVNQLYGKKFDKKTFFMPWPIFNVIEGGVHARNNLDFQEFQVIPQDYDFTKAFEVGNKFYNELKSVLEERCGKRNVSLGDEAGFSAPLKNNEAALEIIKDVIRKNNSDLKIGLDIAANQLFNKGHYFFDNRKFSPVELMDYYLNLTEKYDILSIEDPFFEDAFDDFANLKEEFLKRSGRKNSPFIITDDLTTTNPERFLTAIEKNAGGAIIVKPNQIGTLSETIKVAQMADRAGWGKVVSHRSGETKDDFIADLAVGIQAWGIKAGAPNKPERMAKYERLLKIQKSVSART